MRKFVLHLGKWAMLWALGLSALTLVVDYMIGPRIVFPLTFIFPVALLAWFRPCRWAIMLAAFLCAMRQAISVHWLSETEFDITFILINTLVQMVVLFTVALLVARIARQQHALEARVRSLEGILPVCGFCKKIRNENNLWESIETFISRNSQAQFTHSVCPDCGHDHYPQFCDPVTENPKPAVTTK